MADEPISLPLRKHHGWKAKPGMKLFVADRGAARFQIPEDWVMRPTEDCLRFYDREPPDDDATIGFTLMRIPPVDIPAATWIEEITPHDELDLLEVFGVVEVTRPGISIAWRQERHRDPSGSEAFSRTCIARGTHVAVLLTFDLWVHDVERVSWVWDEVLATIELERYVADPTIGDVDTN